MDNGTELQDIVVELLVEKLAEHGEGLEHHLPFVRRREGVRGILCHDIEHFDYGSIQVVNLSLDLLLGPEYHDPMRHSMLGVAASVEDAIAEALTIWLGCMFTTVNAFMYGEPAESVPGQFYIRLTGSRELWLNSLAPYGDVHRFEFVHRDTTRDAAASWDVYTGPIELRGNDRDRDSLGRCLTQLPPIILCISELSNVIHQDELYWLKLFAARTAAGAVTGECTLNNEHWSAGSDAMLHGLQLFPWPDTDEYLSFGQFFILQPKP